jgi:hypothetical protein
LAFTPHIKALGLISEFQPMRSMDFDNLKQQNGLDSSCKVALTQMVENSSVMVKNFEKTNALLVKVEHQMDRFIDKL